MKIYRKYKSLADIINIDTNMIECSSVVFNLLNVEEYSDVDNSVYGYKDNIKRTEVYLNTNSSYRLRVSFQEFEKVMDSFLSDYELLDDRSIKKKDNIKNALIEITPNSEYNGPMTFSFITIKNKVLANAYPKGFIPKTIEEAIEHVLFTNITPLS